MVQPFELSKTEIANKQYLVWNTFISLLTKSNYKDMNDIQSVAMLSFWYDSEVQNGGHLQYFENKGKLFKNRERLLVNSTLEALNIIGGKEQANILSSASEKYLALVRKHTQDVFEFCALELEDEFGEYDRRYYKCSPDMNSFLEKYLQQHLEAFVKLI
jgi:Domain of unknown function (DUF4375)